LVAPSGSQELDAAAVSCVPRLRFQPATRLGDGTAVESWQQTRWTWASTEHPARANAASQSAPSAAAALAAEVQVCVDATGKLMGKPRLTRPSGDTQFDAAAVEVAKSGSGLYRAGAMDGKAAAGCLQLTIAPSGP
jgi:outer membrane biosynthesis protein TonB